MTTRIVIQPNVYSLIKKFVGFEKVLDKYLALAGQESSTLLVSGAQQNMDWKNPTGALQESIQYLQINPKYFQIGSDLPYARRREFGFTGMTDSLGRTYSYDPGAFFMTKSIDQAKGSIHNIYLGALILALTELSSGAAATQTIVQAFGG